MEKQLLQRSSTEFNAVNISRLFLQPKLTINQPNDVYEQEADAMADKVMRMEQPGVQLKSLPITAVQRKCEHCEEEEKVQRKEINGEETNADSKLENYVGGLSSGGQPLPNEVRSFYEPRFGYDFSNVKIHTDTVAAKSAQSINALAYTSGSNIVFNAGQYLANTDSGKRLLGHELTHVVQQGSAAQQNGMVQRKPSDNEGDPIHDDLLDDFSRDTGTPREEASQHSPDYEKWLEGSASDQLFSSFQIKAADLNNPEIVARFKRMTLEQLHEYRSDYIFNGANDPVVIKHITDQMLSMPLQGCSQADIQRTNTKAAAALATMAGLVKNADRAITLLLSDWVNNKADLLSKRFSFAGEVPCAFKSNFNIDERNPDFGVFAIRVSSRLSQLQKRLSRPINFTCEGINHPVCLGGTGMDADAFVVNHQDPVHLCIGFRDSGDTMHQQAVIVHELLHFLPGLGDAGGYSSLGAQATTCSMNLKFSAATNLLVNSADSIAGFILHVDQNSPTDVRVI